MEHRKSWGHDLAIIWTRMVGPSRPTVSELAVYSRYAHLLQEEVKRRLRILILGSTPEFRDWAFEENMIVTVMDFSMEYHQTISREIRHKSIIEGKQGKETFICCRWQSLSEINEYDIIIGDLVIGNIAPDELNDFLARVARALTKNGMFLGKSFFVPRGYIPRKLSSVVEEYYNGPQYHPYSSLAFHLTMHCVDKNGMLSFQKQFHELEKLKSQGIIKTETMEYFIGVGWDNEMKFRFYVPKVEQYEEALKKHFFIYDIQYGNDVYSPFFPLYISTNKLSDIFRR